MKQSSRYVTSHTVYIDNAAHWQHIICSSGCMGHDVAYTKMRMNKISQSHLGLYNMKLAQCVCCAVGVWNWQFPCQIESLVLKIPSLLQKNWTLTVIQICHASCSYFHSHPGLTPSQGSTPFCHSPPRLCPQLPQLFLYDGSSIFLSLMGSWVGAGKSHVHNCKHLLPGY